MTDELHPQKYRIGEFARWMGVTPDFLKHYEEHGLLDADQRQSGYRYFDFHQSPIILECMRLKNYGVTVREMPHLLTELPGGEANASLDEYVDTLKKRILRDSAVVEEHDRMTRWLARHRWEEQVSPVKGVWEVREIESLLYLPHSQQLRFLQDPAIHAILPKWADWLPVVKSALAIQPQADDGSALQKLPFRWGLIVREASAKKYGIPVNEVVERIPAGRAFILPFREIDADNSDEAFAERICAPLRLMDSLGLKPRGDFFMVMLMHAKMHGAHERYGFFVAPLLKEDNAE